MTVGSTTDMNAILDLMEVEKVYDSRAVLSRCSLTIPRGTITAVVGPNGAGKTTLFKIITGLVKPTSGRVEIFGKPLGAHSLSDIGSMIETPFFYGHMTALENLTTHLAYMCGLDPDSDQAMQMAELALKRVELSHTGSTPVSSFSLGMKQRLGIARAIVHSPKLLVLDEPANGLDPIGIVGLRLLLTQLTKDEGMTVLISSHLLSELEKVAERALFIHEGALDPVFEVTGDNDLEKLYMKRFGGVHYA